MDAAWNAQNRGPDLFIVTTVLLALSVFFVGLRCLTRVFITHSFQVDDWFMLVALVNYVLFAAFVYAGIHFGMGKHNSVLSQRDEIEATKYQALATTLYVSNMAFVKLSIGFFLLRIAVERRYTWTLKISMAVIGVWTAAIFFFTIFQCSPVEAQWDTTIENAKCVSGESFVDAAYAFSVLAILSDWLYALIPIPMVWNVRMSLRAKVVVIGVLSLGVFASIATLIRVKYLIQLETLDDLLYSATDSLIWSLIECAISMIAASVVTMRPLLRAMKIEGFGSSGGSRHHRQTGYAEGAYARATELKYMPQSSRITKNVSMEYTVSPQDGASDSGSADDILSNRNATITRAWGGDSRVSQIEPR